MKRLSVLPCFTLVATLLVLAPFSAQSANFSVPKVSGIAVDGDPGEWKGQGLEVAVLSRIGHVGIKNEATGEVDLRVGWNDEGFLLLVRVFDKDRFESGVKSLYRGDSIEVFLSPEVGSPNYVQVLAAAGIKDSEKPDVRSAVVGYGSRKDQQLPITVTGAPDAAGYWLEALIPWATLGITAQAGRNVGFQIFINDRDVAPAQIGNYTKRNNEIDHICWFPDRMTAFDQTRMQNLKLVQGAVSPILIRTDLVSVGNTKHLKLDALAIYAGKEVQVLQGGKTLGKAPLKLNSAVNLAEVDLPLGEFDEHGEALSLVVEGKAIGSVPLYVKLDESAAAAAMEANKTGDDSIRLAALKALETTVADPLLQADIAILLPLVSVWAEGRKLAESGQLKEPDDYLMFSVNPMSPPALREDSPLYPIYCLFRARNMVWRGIQGGFPEEVQEYYDAARALLGKARVVIPDNPVINMYLSEPIPWPNPAPHANAPQWANDQRAGLEKLTTVIHWWADERQMANGSFGGGWNDDVEMWRNWWPVMFAFTDKKAAAAQERISTKIFQQDHMKSGYSGVMDDVEHSSEDSADTITPMLFLDPTNPAWKEKALNIARIMRDVWTAPDDQGNLMFKNIVFNATATGKDPKNAYDTTLDFRAVQPALVYWQMTRDPALTPQFTKWMDTWVKVAMSDRNGKPAGVVPTAFHWPDGRIGGPNKWWDAEGFSSLYNWPHYVTDALHGLLIAFQVTGDEKYVEPLRAMAKIRRDYLKKNPKLVGADASSIGLASFGRRGTGANDDPAAGLTPGSLDWCAAQMGPILPGALIGYRVLTGDKQFDDILTHDGDGYMRFVVDGKRDGIASDLGNVATAFASNRAGYTTEVRWTDRVFRFTPAFLKNYPASPPPPNTRLLYSTASGDSTTWVGCRLAPVRWLTEPTEIAALVTGSSQSSFTAELFHFGSNPREMAAQLSLLKKGSYEAILRKAGGKEISRNSFTIDGPVGKASFTLPPHELCELEIVASRK